MYQIRISARLGVSVANRQNLCKKLTFEPSGMTDRPVKVVFLGSVAVGKTALMTRLTEDRFLLNPEPTTAAAHANYKTEDGANIQFWDTAGMERYRAINKIYYRDALLGLLVFDLSNRQSFKDLRSWKEDFIREDSTGSAALIIIGNKCDLTSQAQVTEEEAKGFADEQGADYFSTSALSGEGVVELRHAIIMHLGPSLVRSAALEKGVTDIAEESHKESNCC
jgi:small GTP-binding protein